MAPSLRSQVFFLSDTKVKSKNCVTLWPLLICTVLVGGEVKILISQYNQNLLHRAPPKFFEKKASYALAQVLQCPQVGGQPLPLEWVTGLSRVNIVAKSPYRSAFLLAWVRAPSGVFSKEHSLHIVHAVCFKSSTVQKTFYLPQASATLWEALGAKWGTLGPWKAQTEAAAIALNQKVVYKFF